MFTRTTILGGTITLSLAAVAAVGLILDLVALS